MSSPSDLIGSWKYEEHPVKPNDPPVYILDPLSTRRIVIDANKNFPQFFDVKAPLSSGSELDLICIPLMLDTVGRYILSGTDGTGAIGLRLVFDLSASQPVIFGNTLGSTIERWAGGQNFPQPGDMGTITGTKG